MLYPCTRGCHGAFFGISRPSYKSCFPARLNLTTVHHHARLPSAGWLNLLPPTNELVREFCRSLQNCSPITLTKFRLLQILAKCLPRHEMYAQHCRFDVVEPRAPTAYFSPYLITPRLPGQIKMETFSQKASPESTDEGEQIRFRGQYHTR
jgi:hypothetical protein